MPWETLVSQTSPSYSPNITTAWFPARPPRGYEALPCENSEYYGDVELCALKLSSDVEAARPVTDRPSPSRTTILGVLKMFATLVAFGLFSALVFSAWAWLAGEYLLGSTFKFPPYTAMDPAGMLKASMAGAPVIALIVSATTLIQFVFLGPGLPPPRLNSETDRTRRATALKFHPAAWAPLLVFAVCAPMSAFSMPMGLVMMPHVRTDGYRVRHALRLSATGLAVLIVPGLLALPTLFRSR